MADALKDMIAEVQAEIDSGAGDPPAEEAARAAPNAGEAEPEQADAETAESEAGAGDGQQGEGDAAQAEVKPDPKERQRAAVNKGMQKRIDQLTAQKTAAERRVEEAEARAAAAEARAAAAEARRVAEEDAPAEGETQQPQRRTSKTEAEIRAEVEREFRQKTEAEARAKQEQEFTERSNAAYEAGVKQFGKDFGPAVETLNAIGLNAETLAIALATDAPAKVLYQLGNDPDEAERIFALSPVRMAMEMAKIASSRPRQVAGKPVSQAPDPIRPVGGRGTESDDLTAEASDAAVDKYLKGFNERYARKWG